MSDCRRIYIKDTMTGEMVPADNNMLSNLGYESTLLLPPLENKLPSDTIVEVECNLIISKYKISLIKWIRNTLNEHYVYCHNTNSWTTGQPLDHNSLCVKGVKADYRLYGLKHIKLFCEGSQTLVLPLGIYEEVVESLKNKKMHNGSIGLDTVSEFHYTAINAGDNLTNLLKRREEIMDSLLEVDKLISHYLYSEK